MSHRCAVLGNPIAHSRSPEIHARLARDHAIDLRYERILVPEGRFTDIVRQFFTDGGRGLNVTLPYKKEAYELADWRTSYAMRAQAANTLWLEGNTLCADNTDGRGLIDALTEDIGFSLNGRRVILIGAGGAARGALLPLLESGVARLDIMNRTLERAASIIDDHLSVAQVPIQALPLGEPPEQGYDLIINASSAGLSGALSALPGSLIANPETTLCYDMIYGSKTPFLNWAARHGVTHRADGSTMLERQAERSFRIWFDREITG